MASASSKSESELLPLPLAGQSSFHDSVSIDLSRFVTPWTVDSTVGPVEVANLPSDAAQCSIFLMPWEVYIHRGHALEHRFFRWDRNGVNEQFPWDRGDTQDTLAIKVRIPGRSEMKQLNMHDLICYTYKLPISLVVREWSDSYIVHHGGPGLHFDSRLQHLHMQSRSEHSRHAGSKRRRRSDGGRRKLCSVNCQCVSAKA